MPFYPFVGEGPPTKIDYREKGTLILISTGGPRRVPSTHTEQTQVLQAAHAALRAALPEGNALVLDAEPRS